MSHRFSLTVVGLLLAVPAGCSDGLAPSTCVIEKYRIEGTPLTLLPDARLDRVGDGFVLLGSDGGNVLWASLGTNGIIGPEHMIAVPAHVGRPWFAVAGTTGPMDHLVVAYVPAAAATTGMVDLMTFAVGFDNTTPTLPVAVGRIPAAAEVAMMSGRGGMHAALTWRVSGTSTISAQVLGGDGRAIGEVLVLGNVGNSSCLRFLPGKGDLTIGYADLSATPLSPTFVAREISAAGIPQNPFTLRIGNQLPSCVELVPTDTGYGVAWHSEKIGTFFGVFEPTSSQFPNQPVLDDVRVAKEDQPVILGGVGWLGKQYAVVFARPKGAEVWPIDAMGHRMGSLPVLPSDVGNTGTLSTQPVGSVFYATYADYASADPANQSSGIRFLVKVSCP